MFLMRRAKAEDVLTLLKLAKMVHFINLPADKDIIADKAMWSRQCFLKAAHMPHHQGEVAEEMGERTGEPRGSPSSSSDATGLASLITRSDFFMFVLEDLESHGVLGTSQIISKMGGPGHPNVSFELSRREMFSKSLQVGTTHTVAKLVLDETGPTEIGGLILQPSYRGHKARLGRFLSLVRFHFMGLYPELFSDRIIAEMMGPLTPDGRNTLWEYLGRRFINLSYPEADNFCQYSKEFMISLLPREEIYLTLLPPEARSVIAEVGPETVPARKMLEKLGFAYKNRIDPFDGGPMLEARTRDISVVSATRRMTVREAQPNGGAELELAMVSTLDRDGEFRCMTIPVAIGPGDTVDVDPAYFDPLELEPGKAAGVTPLGEKVHPQHAADLLAAHIRATSGSNGSTKRSRAAKAKPVSSR